MTLEVAAPVWPARVIAVEADPLSVTRGSAAEFRKCGLFVERADSVSAGLVALAQNPRSIPLIPWDLDGMSVTDFIDIAQAMTPSPVIVGLPPEVAEEDVVGSLHRQRARIVRFPVTAARLARAIVESRPRPVAPTFETYQIGGLHLDVEAFRVSWHGHDVHLPPRLFELMRYFAAAHPRVVSLEELVSEFGANNNTRDRGERVRVMIGRTRTLFTITDPDRPPPLETVYRVGYRLTGD